MWRLVWLVCGTGCGARSKCAWREGAGRGRGRGRASVRALSSFRPKSCASAESGSMPRASIASTARESGSPKVMSRTCHGRVLDMPRRRARAARRASSPSRARASSPDIHIYLGRGGPRRAARRSAASPPRHTRLSPGATSRLCLGYISAISRLHLTSPPTGRGVTTGGGRGEPVAGSVLRAAPIRSIAAASLMKSNSSESCT